MRSRSTRPTALIAVIMVLLAILYPACARPAESAIELRAAAAAVLVQTPGGTGSGTCVASDSSGAWFLTCQHVVDGEPLDKLTISFGAHGSAIQAWLVREDPSVDLALLYVPGDQHCPSLRLARSVPLLGEEVFSIGAPLGIPWIASHGRVGCAEPRQFSRQRYFVVDMKTIPGMSGSALLNSRGEICGVMAATVLETNIGLAVPLEEVRRFLGERW